MNTSNKSQKQTQGVYSGSKVKADTYAYRIGNSIYINLTNRCTNDCEFCLRNNGDTAYGSDSLWLKREPTPEDVLSAIEEIFFTGCESFVFCGYGEPTCRFEALIQTAKLLKRRYTLPIRLNTNGQSELINGGSESTCRLFGLIDKVSISLNTASPEEYDKLCKPVFGADAYKALLDFGEHCVCHIPEVQFSVVATTISDDDIEKCRLTVEEIGAKLRVRKFISENDKNPE